MRDMLDGCLLFLSLSSHRNCLCIYNLRVGARSDQATATVDATVIRYLMMQGAWICG